MIFECDYGDQITARAAFTNPAAEPTNPTTVRWRLRPPSGPERLITATDATHTLASPATGTHTLTFTPEAPGRWVVRCEGLGAVQQADEESFSVVSSALSTASIS